MQSIWLQVTALFVCIHSPACSLPQGTPLEYVPFAPGSIKNLPSSIHACHRRQKKFNLCAKTALQEFFNIVSRDARNMNMPTIDPLFVPKMALTEGADDVIINLTFTNVSIFGLSNTKIIAVRSNLEDNKIEVTVKHSHLNLVGDYVGEGGVKTLPIVGDGEFSFNMTDVSAAWIIYLTEAEGSMEKHLTIDNFLIDIIPVEISAKFGNAIDGDKNLGTALNGFFNENAQEIFKMTKPKITEALSTVFSSLANDFLLQYSSEVLLPP